MSTDVKKLIKDAKNALVHKQHKLAIELCMVSVTSIKIVLILGDSISTKFAFSHNKFSKPWSWTIKTSVPTYCWVQFTKMTIQRR